MQNLFIQKYFRPLKNIVIEKYDKKSCNELKENDYENYLNEQFKCSINNDYG
jgi:hypothetical protein